jgi:hypothetical protein
MTDWNVPLDVSHRIARGIMEKVRTDLIAIHEANATWEPSPVPEGYHPSPDERLHPRPYDQPLHVLGDRWLRPNRHGDAVIFYDYCLRIGHRSTTSLYH